MNKIKLISEACTMIMNEIFFVEKYFNIIFKINIKTKEINICGMIPEEDIWKERTIGDICTWGDKLIFAPSNANKIWIVDKQFCNWESIELDDENEQYKFYICATWENKLFLINYCYSELLCYDLITKEKMNVEWKCEKANAGKFSSYNIENNKIYFTSDNTSNIFVLDMKERSIETIVVNTNIRGFHGISVDQSGFWLISSISGELIYSTFDGEIVKYITLGNIQALGLINCNDKIYVYGYGDGGSAIWNKLSNSKEIIKNKYSLVKRINRDISICESEEGELSVFDSNINNIFKIELLVDDNIMQKYYFQGVREPQSHIFNEGRDLSLKSFLNII